MGVTVDQPRHQGPPAKIDDLGAGRLDGAVRDLGEQTVLDQHLMPGLENPRVNVEQVQVLQQDWAHRFLPSAVSPPLTQTVVLAL